MDYTPPNNKYTKQQINRLIRDNGSDKDNLFYWVKDMLNNE